MTRRAASAPGKPRPLPDRPAAEQPRRPGGGLL